MEKSTITMLIDVALKARENAYAPYSSFCVGAAVLCDSGKIYQGANCENASYPAGICAERAALFSAISKGERRLVAIALVGGECGSDPGEIITPCGICRQALTEHGDSDMPVICARDTQEYTVFTLGELLPGAFNKDSLGKNK